MPAGWYSCYASQRPGPPTCTEPLPETTAQQSITTLLDRDQDFLRGVVEVDSAGNAQLVTIVPGPYHGRWRLRLAALMC